MDEERSPVLELATRQLAAYNRADLSAFCACYSEDVRVLDAEGGVSVAGQEAFRVGYGQLFGNFTEVKAQVSERLSLRCHVVEREQWQRTNRETGKTESGEILVRYTERDGLIALVEFLR